MYVCASMYRLFREWGQPWEPKWRLCTSINWSINGTELDNIKIYLKIMRCNNGVDSIGMWQGPRAFSEWCHLYTSASPVVSSSEYRNRHVPAKRRSGISKCFRTTPARARCGYEQMPLNADCDISLDLDCTVRVSKVGIETCRHYVSLLAIHVLYLKPSDFATGKHGYSDIGAEVTYTEWRCYSLHACGHDMSWQCHKHVPHKVEDFRQDSLLTSPGLTSW